MQRVLSADLWQIARKHARKARQRKAAIAYVTRDLVGFRSGDVLVLNASSQAIAAGETSARLLRTLLRKRVRLYHCGDLHAKVLLLGDVAVIGSGNMSSSSADALVEAAVLTDQASTVSGVASFIEQLVRQSEELDEKEINRLCRIKVVRRGGPAGARHARRRRTRVPAIGNRTWLVGVEENHHDPPPSEQRMIAKAAKTIRRRLRGSDREADWIRWTGKGRFVNNGRQGDSLIQIVSAHRAKRPGRVFRWIPVLLKQKAKRWTRCYFQAVTGPRASMRWGKFKRLLKELGYSRRVGGGAELLLDPELADAIERRWNSFAKP